MNEILKERLAQMYEREGYSKFGITLEQLEDMVEKFDSEGDQLYTVDGNTPLMVADRCQIFEENAQVLNVPLYAHLRVVGEESYVANIEPESVLQVIGEYSFINICSALKVQMVGRYAKLLGMTSKWIQVIGDFADFPVIPQNSWVQIIGDNVSINLIQDNANVQIVGDNADIGIVGKNCEIQILGNDAKILQVEDKCKIQFLGHLRNPIEAVGLNSKIDFVDEEPQED